MEKKSFGKVYIDFWKRAFDLRGTSDRREFWLPVGLHIGLLLIVIVLWLCYWDNPSLGWLSIPFWIFLVFLFLTLQPFVAVTVRRLRDTGMSGLWAFLLLFVGAGTFVVLALCAGSTGFYPGGNQPVNVYGPPPWLESTDFDPSQNEPVDVYGPPEWFDPTKEGSDPSEETPEYDPENNITPPVYGAPDFDPTDNEPVPVYGPPEWFETKGEESSEEPDAFDPSLNTDAPLYGAPVWPTEQK